ncbi:MAG TPA: tetratricopeptide repeat protein, partial [Tepidisphaeraceae bacterium]|nr:tetratricopeptide repeat protein [Tepidisphaeraceae bacterium]
MPHGDEALSALREALKLSPDNIPLRLHLAETLMGFGRPEEAEKEFRQALAVAPGDVRLKLGLANAFYQQGKNSHALVIVEELIKQSDAPAKAHLIYSKLLFRAGDVERAVRQYKRAVEIDPAASDSELATRLGIRSGNDEASDSNSDVVDGRVRESWQGEPDDEAAEVERPKINFKDVGGMESLKDEIRMKIIHPLSHPELYKAYGKTIGGGILMYGPPGCGKTHLARATAGEIKASFMSIGINDVL